jgi:hypothetical protein
MQQHATIADVFNSFSRAASQGMGMISQEKKYHLDTELYKQAQDYELTQNKLAEALYQVDDSGQMPFLNKPDEYRKYVEKSLAAWREKARKAGNGSRYYTDNLDRIFLQGETAMKTKIYAAERLAERQQGKINFQNTFAITLNRTDIQGDAKIAALDHDIIVAAQNNVIDPLNVGKAKNVARLAVLNQETAFASGKIWEDEPITTVDRAMEYLDQVFESKEYEAVPGIEDLKKNAREDWTKNIQRERYEYLAQGEVLYQHALDSGDKEGAGKIRGQYLDIKEAALQRDNNNYSIVNKGQIEGFFLERKGKGSAGGTDGIKDLSEEGLYWLLTRVAEGEIEISAQDFKLSVIPSLAAYIKNRGGVIATEADYKKAQTMDFTGSFEDFENAALEGAIPDVLDNYWNIWEEVIRKEANLAPLRELIDYGKRFTSKLDQDELANRYTPEQIEQLNIMAISRMHDAISSIVQGKETSVEAVLKKMRELEAAIFLESAEILKRDIDVDKNDDQSRAEQIFTLINNPGLVNNDRNANDRRNRSDANRFIPYDDKGAQRTTREQVERINDWALEEIAEQANIPPNKLVWDHEPTGDNDVNPLGIVRSADGRRFKMNAEKDGWNYRYWVEEYIPKQTKSARAGGGKIPAHWEPLPGGKMRQERERAEGRAIKQEENAWRDEKFPREAAAVQRNTDMGLIASRYDFSAATPRLTIEDARRQIGEFSADEDAVRKILEAWQAANVLIDGIEITDINLLVQKIMGNR